MPAGMEAPLHSVRQRRKIHSVGCCTLPARKGAVGGCSFIKQLWLNAVFKFISGQSQKCSAHRFAPGVNRQGNKTYNEIILNAV